MQLIYHSTEMNGAHDPEQLVRELRPVMLRFGFKWRGTIQGEPDANNEFTTMLTYGTAGKDTDNG